MLRRFEAEVIDISSLQHNAMSVWTVLYCFTQLSTLQPEKYLYIGLKSKCIMGYMQISLEYNQSLIQFSVITKAFGTLLYSSHSFISCQEWWKSEYFTKYAPNYHTQNNLHYPVVQYWHRFSVITANLVTCHSCHIQFHFSLKIMKIQLITHKTKTQKIMTHTCRINQFQPVVQYWHMILNDYCEFVNISNLSHTASFLIQNHEKNQNYCTCCMDSKLSHTE